MQPRRCAKHREMLAHGALSDEEVVERVRRGEVTLFEVLMRRLNQRLYRIVRAILGDDAEVDDVLQETYLSAYAGLGQFAGRAQPSTWIARIAIHAAYARARRRRLMEPTAMNDGMVVPGAVTSPEQLASARELSELLERAIDGLPEAYRVVFVMREVEQLDTAATASLLDVSPILVRVRLHRARALLRRALSRETVSEDAFRFLRPRCDALTAAVLGHIHCATGAHHAP